MSTNPVQDRAEGALLGAWIGDALGLGPHWYYSLQELDWGQTGGHADTTEAIERTLAIAVRYALQPSQLAAAITANTLLTQTDDTVVSMTVAFGAV